MNAPRQPIAGRRRGRPRGPNPLGFPFDAVRYLGQKRSRVEATALIAAAREFTWLRLEDPLEEYATSDAIESLVTALDGVSRAVAELPAEARALQREVELPETPRLHDARPFGRVSGPSFVDLASVAESWLRALEPRRWLPQGELLARLMAREDRTAFAGWLLLSRREAPKRRELNVRGWWSTAPTATELAALAVYFQGDEPSPAPSPPSGSTRWRRFTKPESQALDSKRAIRDEFELKKRVDRWRKALAAAQRVINGTGGKPRGRRFFTVTVR